MDVPIDSCKHLGGLGVVHAVHPPSLPLKVSLLLLVAVNDSDRATYSCRSLKLKYVASTQPPTQPDPFAPALTPSMLLLWTSIFVTSVCGGNRDRPFPRSADRREVFDVLLNVCSRVQKMLQNTSV